MKSVCKLYLNRLLLSVTILLIISVIIKPAEAKAKKIKSTGYIWTVVIDPGHGGHDKGVQGANGTQEKNVTLAIARMIAAELKDQFRSVMTRADDYWIDILDRTAIANHVKADIFISIHTGGSFTHKASGINIFYFKQTPGLSTTLPKKLPTEKLDYLWDNLQNKHSKSSLVLSELIRDYIKDRIKLMEINIQEAPLMVLAGADMPAILIETGNLSNPSDEKKINDKNILLGIAKGISDGIKTYLKNH